jgi:hypothetical protein
MQMTLNKEPRLRLSAKSREIIVDVVVYLFIILFMYTAANKLLTVKSFASTLAKSPLIGSLNIIVAWAIPIIEIGISLLLIIPSIRKTGLRASLFLMILFTLYLMYMVFSGSTLPCHCGGVISEMSWQQHIWFNLGFVALAIIGLVANKK